MTRWLGPSTLACLVVLVAACRDKDTKAGATATASAPDDARSGDDRDEGRGEDPREPGVVSPTTGEEAKADGDRATSPADGDAEAGKADDGKVADAKTDDGKADAGKADEGKADGGDTGAPADPKALLAEVTGKKTTDDRAMAALAEAEAAGEKPRELAKAATARGTKLFETPDRAKQFFEWAAAKDPKYPDPVFQLAKQAAMVGEVDQAKDYLKQVHDRGGKKLLSQIDFDPMWDILKDDPEIRKLLP